MESLNLKKFIQFYLEEVMPEKEKDCNTKEFKELRKDADETFNRLLNQLNEEQKADLYALEESLAEIRYESEDYVMLEPDEYEDYLAQSLEFIEYLRKLCGVTSCKEEG